MTAGAAPGSAADTGVPPDLFWQDLPAAAGGGAPYRDRYWAALPGGRWLMQPLRPLPGPAGRAVASLIVTQCSFDVERYLLDCLADVARPWQGDIVVGVPTLGLIPARGLAQRLGHDGWVALGTSAKFWYDESLSVPARSITTPGGGKRLYLDPRMLGRLAGRRILLVDDVVSSGESAAAALALLAKAGVAPVAVLALMLQGTGWQTRLAGGPPVRGVFATPLFEAAPGGWTPVGTPLAAPSLDAPC